MHSRRAHHPASLDDEERNMGFTDKLDNTKDDLAGKAKEATGKATDNERLEGEGKADQAEADVKQAGEKVKDAFKH
ncbi:hypothetical protein GCM10027080_00270 [Pedococcus soli]